MIIPKEAMGAYGEGIARQADEAARRMREYLADLDFTGDYESRMAARDAAMEFFKELVSVYGDAAGTIAADFYEELAEAAGESVGTAVLAEADEASMEGSVRYAARNLFGPQASAQLFAEAMERAVRTYVKKMANDTMSANAVRDGRRGGVRFARVPSGAETCAFCLMLASRGFVYANRDTAGEFDHYHDDCDCRIVPGFGDDPQVEGYDVESYRDFYYGNAQYDGFGHLDVDGTLNSMRRALYPEAKEERNSRRREVYRIRKEAERNNSS